MKDLWALNSTACLEEIKSCPGALKVSLMFILREDPRFTGCTDWPECE
jgi:hypothetical protein